MAASAQTCLRFDIFEDDHADSRQSVGASPSAVTDSLVPGGGDDLPVLDELPLANSINTARRRDPDLDSLVISLGKLKLRDSPKRTIGSVSKSKPRGLQNRPAITRDTFREPGTSSRDGNIPLLASPMSVVAAQACQTGEDSLKYFPTILPADEFPAIDDEIDKLHAATPLEEDEVAYAQTTLIRGKPAMEMVDLPPPYEAHASPAQAQAQVVGPSTPMRVIVGKRNSFVDQANPRSPNDPDARIEDSFEAIDRLEEQLEAINAVTRVKRVPSPEKDLEVAASRTMGKNSSVLKKVTLKPGSQTVRIKSSTPAGRPSLRRSASMTFTVEEDKAPVKPTAKRQSASRPASLLPPKFAARSTKPPTIPKFELPGEAVARRLKEKREARLSQQLSPEKVAAAIVPQRTKSTKAPTRPTFELPGEAISRRKREEREARLKAQEEEERKRREFKAKPIRNSIAPSALPRETIASRARQSKAASAENGVDRPTGSKRQSLAVVPPTRPPLSTTSSTNGSQTSRGRDSLLKSPTAHMSRATSATSNLSEKRSNISSEDVQQQKLRGKEIYYRDNHVNDERDREKRNREALAKLARQEAAERSRLLSRRWAEKQKATKLGASAIDKSVLEAAEY